MADTAPFVQKHQRTVPAVAITTDLESPVVEVPFAGTISSVLYAGAAALNGANTNSRTYTLYNRKADDSGTVAVATLAMVSGVNLVADVEKAITLSSTAADLVVAQGDILAWKSLHVGTGIADPGGLVVVEITRS